MDEAVSTRWWNGVGDPIHPLNRSAHASVTHGRYIYVISGYNSKENELCLFDRAGLARYDIVTNSIHFLPIHWDSTSLKRHGCNQSYLSTSGLAAALQTDSNDGFIYIYVFAGFSLLDAFHTNSLVRLQIPQNQTPVEHDERCSLAPPHWPCVRASVCSGHSLLCHILSLTWDSLKAFILYTTLRALRRRLCSKTYGRRCRSTGEPSPRDKMCMEYWQGQLYVFGGYGPNFSPPSYWPVHILNWPFLHQQESNEWYMCEHNRGWNNQLLIYNISQGRWILANGTLTKGKPPCARAAHQSCVYSDRGWLLIFGGRGPLRSRTGEIYESGRLNDLHCLNLSLLEWSRVSTPLDVPGIERPVIWPCGRSWMGLTAVDSLWTERKSWLCVLDEKADYSSCPVTNYPVRFLVSGGFSNSHEALSDMYLIEANQCPIHNCLEARVVAESSGQTQTFGYRPIATPKVLNGFTCVNKSNSTEPTFLKILKNSQEVLVHHEQDYLNGQFYRSHLPFIQQDVTELLTMYSTLSFLPQIQLHNPLASSKQSFYRIARSHTDVILYLLSNFCCYTEISDMNKKIDEKPVLDELDNLSMVILDSLDAAGQVLSTLASILVRFMLPWEPVMMVLSEKDTWLSQPTYTSLLHKLIYANSAPNLNFVTLLLTQKLTLEQLITLLPVDLLQIQCSAWSTVSHLHNRLSIRVRHAILSFLLEHDRSPLHTTADHLSLHLLPSDPTCSRVPLFTLKPVGLSNLPRFWHSVSQGIDGSFYVVGGHQTDSTSVPVECFRQLEPLPLKAICSRLASQVLTKHCPRLRELVSSSVGYPRSSSVHDDLHCSCTFCTSYHLIQNTSLESQLLKWLS